MIILSLESSGLKELYLVASSPFLLNATVRHHMESYEESFPSTVAKLLNSMYVDDMVCGSNTEREAYQLYSRGELMRKKEFPMHRHLSARL